MTGKQSAASGRAAMSQHDSGMRKVPSFMSLNMDDEGGDALLAHADPSFALHHGEMADDLFSSIVLPNRTARILDDPLPPTAASQWPEDLETPTPPRASKTGSVDLHTFSLSSISSAQDIETMSGPVLRAFLKAICIRNKGKRIELIELLKAEWSRHLADPVNYAHTLSAKLEARRQAHATHQGTESASSQRRLKKRSLKAREADEGVPLRGKELRASRSGLYGVYESGSGGGGASEGGSGRKLRAVAESDPAQMSDAERLERYEMVARLLVWALRGERPPADKDDLLRVLSSTIGFNAYGAPRDSCAATERTPDWQSAIVGRRVEVQWVDMSGTTKWYGGLVLGYNADDKQHRVVYDDGAERVESLDAKQWRLASVQLLCEVDGQRTTMQPSAMEPLVVRSADGTGESDSASGAVSEAVEDERDEHEDEGEADAEPDPPVPPPEVMTVAERRPSSGGSIVHACRQCGIVGHNKRTCPEARGGERRPERKGDRNTRASGKKRR